MHGYCPLGPGFPMVDTIRQIIGLHEVLTASGFPLVASPTSSRSCHKNFEKELLTSRSAFALLLAAGTTILTKGYWHPEVPLRCRLSNNYPRPELHPVSQVKDMFCDNESLGSQLRIARPVAR